MCRLAIFITIFIFTSSFATAQCPISIFSLPMDGCINEAIPITNVNIEGVSYEFDFCGEDLVESPDVNLLFRNLNWDGVSDINLISENGNWLAFVVSSANNRLFRLEFGLDIENPAPTIVDMGNIDNQLVNPESIDLYKEGENWFGLVLNYTESSIVRLNFGTSLYNIPTSDKIVIDMNHNLTFGSTIKIIVDDPNIFALIANRGGDDLIRFSFGNSISNTPLVESLNLFGLSSPRGVDFTKVCADSWYVFTFSTTTNTLHRLEFSSLSSIPTITNLSVSGDIISGGITPILQKDFGKYYILLTSSSGDLYRIDIGSDIQNVNVTAKNLSNFGILPRTTAFDLVRIAGKYFGYSIGNNKFLYNYNFEKKCPVLPSYLIDSTPLTISYRGAGQFGVVLNVSNSNNESASFTQPITISPSLAPQISAQITDNCLSTPINFSGQQLSGIITSWNWDFGDGLGTSSLQNDTYTYATAGSYQVRLSVTDANGCNNLLIDSVTVYEEPIPNFSTPVGNLCMNNPITFTNTSTGASGPVVLWTWDFNGEGNSTERDPTFTFLTPGSKTITLTSSIPGCANVTQQTITIEEAPSTAFAANDVCNGQTTTFTDLTTGNNLTTWNWDFGDGTISTTPSPTHNYTNPGKYVVTLVVGNTLGCSTTKIDTVFNHALPVVNFTNDLPCSTSPIQFSDQSTVQDANIVAWEWDFGDGNTSTDRNPQHTYGQTGDFTVQLKAFSQFGCIDSVVSVISVIQGPVADFSWDRGCVGEPTSFMDLTNSFGQPITSWTWLIDNQVFNQQNPQYSFTSSGTYSIVLSVSTSNLCAQTVGKDIIINNQPTTSFNFIENCGSNSVAFYDTTPPTITTREWRIDGQVTSSDSVMNVNLNPNNYMVSLATTSLTGCSQSLTNEVNIIGAPVADFVTSNDYGAAPLSVQFSNESTGTDTYLWKFGDINSSTSAEVNPRFEYTALGTFNVMLIATGGVDCGDTTVQIIEVVEPEHAFSIDAITPINDGNLALTFSNLGSITYNEKNSRLIFTLDNGAEITESFNTILYPQRTINYVPNFTFGEVGNAKTLCIELQYFNNQEKTILDENCLGLSANDLNVTIYPNPATDFINLAVVLNNATNLSIRLIDSSGALLNLFTDETAKQGLNNYTIETTPYRSGLYLVKIETADENKVIKVVIDR
jgi:PKD repeat protein